MYKTQVRNMLASETQDEYTMRLESHKDTWSQGFRDYFYSSFDGRILMSYRRHLHTCSYNAESVTTNNSESMNAVIKRFQDFNEVPVDRMVHAMYRLQLSYGLQLNKSSSGFGPFTLVAGTSLSSMQLPACTEYDDMLQSLPATAFYGDINETVVDIAWSLLHVPEQQCFSTASASGAIHSVRLFQKKHAHVELAAHAVTSWQLSIFLGCIRQVTGKLVWDISDAIPANEVTRNPVVSVHIKVTLPSMKRQTRLAEAQNASMVSDAESVNSPAPERTKRVRFADDLECHNSTSESVTASGMPSLSEFVVTDGMTSTPMTTEKKSVQIKSWTSRLSRCNSNMRLKYADSEVTTAAMQDSPSGQVLKYVTDGDLVLLQYKTCLNDNIINGAQLLVCGNSTDSGLRDSALVSVHCTQLLSGEKCVQIMHDTEKEYWFVAINRGCALDTVRVYCSLHLRPSDTCLESVLHFVSTYSSTVRFEVMNVAKQVGSTDCSLFAIVFAYLLVTAVDPTTVVFDQEAMRDHLPACFRNGTMSGFLLECNCVVRRKVVCSFVVSVYCMCRQGSLLTQQMIACNSCKEWFHKECISMCDNDFQVFRNDKTKKFFCPQCQCSVV